MIKSDDLSKGQFATFLSEGNFETTMTLSLEVTHTGTLAPSLRFPHVAPNLAIGATLSASNSVKRKSYKKLRFSMKQLRKDWLSNRDYGHCPEGEGFNIAGDIGIRDLVYNQITSRSTNTSEAAGGKEEFGGTITFTVDYSISSAGPTWTLANFVGPGGFGSLQRSTSNSLIVAFARADDKAVIKRAGPSRADEFLAEIILLEVGK